MKLEYSGKVIELFPYNTLTERDILLSSMNKEFDLDKIMNILSSCIKYNGKLSKSEKILILYTLRSISVGEEIPVKFTCKKCKRINEQGINISDLVTSSNIKNKKIVDRFKELTDENFNDFYEGCDELELDEYEKVFNEAKESVTKFNFIKECKCHSCFEPQLFDISDPEYVIENLSEDSLMSIYQTINDLVFFSHYTKDDVDRMFSFERSILISLLNKTREELNK